MESRTPPQNLEAEQSILGSILLDNEVYAHIEATLRPEHFYKESHRKIFRACERLFRRNEPIDLVTLTEELRQTGELETVGSVPYLIGLADSVPTAAYAESYAKIVAEKATLRDLIGASGQIMQTAYDQAMPIEQILDKAEASIFELASNKRAHAFQGMAGLMSETFAHINELFSNPDPVSGLRTGFKELDVMTAGLQGGSLNILAARPAMGKCLTKDTLIDLPGTGERITVEAFVERRYPCVYGVSDEGRVRPTLVSDWVDSGIKPCYRVSTRSGRSVEVTGHHPFLTHTGWTPLHDLKIGDEIAVPRALPIFGQDRETSLEDVPSLAQRMLEHPAPFPAAVWLWDKERLQRLVQVFFAADEGFTTPSQELAQDLHHALVRLGILGRLEQTLEETYQVTLEEDSSPSSTLSPGSDLYWDAITHILPIGEHQVYDLTVPDGANFIAQDICVHNTAFALTIGQNAALRTGATIGIFSLEMSAVQLVTRMLCSESRVDMSRVRNGQLSDRDFQRLADTAGKMAEAKIYIDDAADLNIMDLRSRCRRLTAEHGLDMIIIDYLQLMSGSKSTSGGGENRQQEIAVISRGLKALARELDVPVLALSQLSRAVESRPNKRPMLSDLRESGCLSGDTLVTLADTGERVPLRELVGKSGFAVWAVNPETLKLERAVVSHAFSTGVKPVFRLETQLGKQVRATANHKFLTLDGWKRLDELKLGEAVALPRELPSAAESSMSFKALALLAHLLGDGCTLPRHAIQYTTRELDLAEKVASLATSVFGAEVAPRIKRERDWYQVYLSSTRHHTHGVRSAVSEWLEELGAWGLRSHEKRVPESVFCQPQEAIAHFLRHLWATDGCINLRDGHYPRVYYASSSERLAQDVQSLLLRLGITARLRQVSQGTKGRMQFHVLVTGHEDLTRFVAQIGAVGAYRQAALEQVALYLADRSGNTNRDSLPATVWQQHVKPAMQANGVTTRALASALEMSYCGTSLYKHGLSRERAAKVATVVGSDSLGQLAASDLYWDKLVRLEPSGEEEVFDLTVPGPHNFIANDLVVHNSIEQDADLVMFIYRDEYYDPHSEKQGIAEIIIGKQRNGPVGTVELQFHNAHVRFNDLAKATP